jgi:hypothetical protein
MYQLNSMEPNYWLSLSSLSYLLPSYIAYSIGYTYLGVLYIVLTTISVIYHSTKIPSLLLIDIPVSHINHILSFLIIIKGGFISISLYLSWLLYTLYSYYYGYQTSSLIWHKDPEKSTPWHAGLHVLTSLITSITLVLSS